MKSFHTLLLFAIAFFSIFLLCLCRTTKNKPPITPTSVSTDVQEVFEEQAVTNEPLRIVFAGDAMFDRNIRLTAEKNGYDYILEDLSNIFSSADLVIINLEGPITDSDSLSVGSEVGSSRNYIFTFDPLVVGTLVNNNIRLVNIGNNHILNFGEDGLKQTIDYLTLGGIEYFGNAGVDDYFPRYKIVKIGDFVLGFVNYNQFVAGGAQQALSDIRLLQDEVDILTLYTHWGIEYETTANKTIENLAHSFVEEGADLVIGSHPHVIQQKEKYNDKWIYYSLGNFVFDQYFSEETKEGLLVEVVIDTETKEMSFVDNKVIMNNSGQTLIYEQ